MNAYQDPQPAVRRLAKRAFRAAGYSLRDVGRGVGGVDLLHDARVLLGDAPGLTLFDVGANVGQTTLAMLDAFDSPEVHAFEPSPATAVTLRQTVGDRPGVTVESIALGETVGRLPFHVTGAYSVNDSLLRPRWDAGGTVVDVAVETVDSYCRLRDLRRIDLLKVDAQGYDLSVLRGARAMLADRRIRLFCCEANFEDLYESQAGLGEVLSFADDVGYRVLSYLDALFRAA
jgi:FkbM family methyltransferase